MKKGWLFVFGGIIVILVAVIIFHYKKSPLIVKTVSVTRGDIIENAQAVGYIKPQHSSTIKSQIDGIVAEIYHKEGEYVTQGTPLVKILPVPSPVVYATAKEEVAETTEIEKVTKKEVSRFDKAHKMGLITMRFGDYLAAIKANEIAKAKHILATQKLALLDEGKTIVGGKEIANIVKSPIDGYILTRKVDIGDPVISLSSAQASTALLLMANMQDLMFQGSVDESDAAKIKMGSVALVSIGALPGTKITGKVSKIALQSDASSGTDASGSSPFSVGFQVEATQLEIPAHLALRSGYSATADIKVQEAHQVLMLPERVLHFENEKPYVLLPAEKDAEPKKRGVELGIADGMTIEIKKGLSLGEKVIDNADTANLSS